MKILMVVDAWFPHYGGGQVHVWELSKGLVDLGHQVTIYTRNLGDWKESYRDIKVIRQGLFKSFANPIGRLWFLASALVYTLTNNFDLIHLHACL